MFAAFAKLREIQILRSIGGADAAFRRRLDPPRGWTLEAILTLDVDALRRELGDILRQQLHRAGFRQH